MTMMRRVVPAQVSALGDDEVEVTMSTGGVARDGHVLVPEGAELDGYKKNPIVLWQHDPEHPVGRSESIGVEGDRIVARIRFAPNGISAKADEIRGLVKSGIISGVSVGFEPKDGEPLDPKRPRGGMRFRKWELLECSFCSVPVDTDAMVTARASRDLPVDEASRLPQTDIPAEVKKPAGKVLDRYKEKTGMSMDSDGGRSLKARHTRALERAPKVPVFKRGLCEVAQLAYMLQQFGYCHECAEYEAALEGDESPVPAMLGEAMVKFGEALIEMAHEEVEELLEEIHEDGDGEDGADMETRELPDDERAFISAGRTPRARAWRRGIALCRSGRTLSASNEKRLNEATAHHERAMKHHRALGEHHEAVSEHMEEVHDHHARASDAHGDLGESLEAMKDEPDKATEHVARALRHHRAVAGHLEDMAHTHAAMTDAHGDLGDAHHSLGRALKAAHRSVRAVVEGSNPSGEDNDSKLVQKSSGSEEDDGARSLDFARRQADLRALAAAAP
jgi:HK97 family phage prohead protease